MNRFLTNLTSFFKSFSTTFLRFPLTLLSSAIATGIIIYRIYFENDLEIQQARELLTFGLGIPLFFALEIRAEREPKRKYIYLILGIGILAAYFIFPLHLSDDKTIAFPFAIRTITLLVVFHLLVAVLPYFGTGNHDGFWSYNKSLFLSILTAALYTATLFAGLSLALLALKALFELDIPDKSFAYLAVFLNVFINTYLFLKNTPALEVSDADRQYPKGLKLFTQYVLLPLVAIYLVILICYELKIITKWSLPAGWVSYLVLASGVFGILAFLLLYPIREGKAWVKQFTKLFYWLLIPLVLLMFVAIATRVNQYGFTELRYLVFLLSLWLMGISLYFILSKKDFVIYIPLTLMIVGLLFAYSPMSGFSISKWHQKFRLNNALEKNELIKDGKIVSNKKPIKLSKEDYDKLDAATEYLEHADPAYLRAMIADTSKVETEDLAFQIIINQLNLVKPEEALSDINVNQNFSVFVDQPVISPVFNADLMVNLYVSKSNQEEFIPYQNEEHFLAYSFEKDVLHLRIEGEDIDLDISDIRKRKSGVQIKDLLLYHGETSRYKVTYSLQTYNEYDLSSFNLNGIIFITKK